MCIYTHRLCRLLRVRSTLAFVYKLDLTNSKVLVAHARVRANAEGAVCVPSSRGITCRGGRNSARLRGTFLGIVYSYCLLVGWVIFGVNRNVALMNEN